MLTRSGNPVSVCPVCNDIRNTIPTRALDEAFSQLNIPLFHPRGLPNLEPREDIRITETAPVVRRDGEGRNELAQLRWSWPGPTGKPVYNFRSEGRSFGVGRCLVPADGFYEFTDPDPPAPKRARKTKWLFTKAGEPWFCIAGLIRATEEGEAFALLTTSPGADVASYHARQIVVLERSDWAKWLDSDSPAGLLLKPSPAGSLTVARAG